VSFAGLINRLTTEAGVPYFLAPGNHDVTPAAALDAALQERPADVRRCRSPAVT